MEDNILSQLDENQRIKRFTQALSILREVGRMQLALLERHEIENKKSLHSGFLYLLRTLESFWENADFVVFLGKGSFKQFAHYPTRALLENLFRLEFYVSKDKNGQNLIANLELLRIQKRLFDVSTSESEKMKLKDEYIKMAKIDGLFDDPLYASIENIKDENLEPFPGLKKLIEASKRKKTDFNWYFHYRMLCEYSHSKLVALIMSNSDPRRTFRQMLTYTYLLSSDAIQLVDMHIEGVTKDIVKEAITNARMIVNAGMSTK